MEKKGLTLVWIGIMIVFGISMGFGIWDVSETAKLKDKIDLVGNYSTKIDSRVDNLIEYMAGEWLKQNNLDEYGWVEQLNCTSKPAYLSQIDSIYNDFVVGKAILITDGVVDSSVVKIVYYKDKTLSCIKDGVVDCKSILCEKNG